MIALPVGQGDAFFLRREKFTALVDGGKSRTGLPDLFRTLVKHPGVDVLVCSHNDADHANGVLGFLESELRCGEVWLPDLWNDRLDDLLDRPSEFGRELIENVARQELPGDVENRPSRVLEGLGDIFADGELERQEDNLDNLRRAAPRSLKSREDNDELEMEMVATLGWRRHWGWAGRRGQLIDEAVGAASRIRAIALCAADRGLPIRWFKHSGSSTSGGISKILVPINAQERVRRPRPKVTALRYLSLSVSNRLSLAFCSPSDENWPGVVFTTDSDLRDCGTIPCGLGAIVTAPHHGAEANKRVYQRLHDSKLEKVIWIRSDGNFASRPGPAFLGEVDRYCTLCRNGKGTKQTLHFRLNGGRWSAGATRACTCL